MEYFEKTIKKTGWSSLITSVIFAILGIILMTKPDETVKFVGIVIGIMFILVGAYKIFTYLANKENGEMFNYDLAFGIISIISGIIVIVYSSGIVALLRIIIGLWIVYSSIIRLSMAMKLKEIGSSIWVYSLIIALAMFACGIFIIFKSTAIIVTLGAIILIYSILDIIESIFFLKNFKDIS